MNWGRKATDLRGFEKAGLPFGKGCPAFFLTERKPGCLSGNRQSGFFIKQAKSKEKGGGGAQARTRQGHWKRENRFLIPNQATYHPGCTGGRCDAEIFMEGER